MKTLQNILIAIVIALLVASFGTSGWLSTWLAVGGAVVAIAALAFTGGNTKNKK
jgi:hypothetical protein